ncbi:MAG: hypothetical protein KDA58_05985 [Planctomycetaceae bacterium]|nr:hypothetical protein [Planctomycetaceae bacterium]
MRIVLAAVAGAFVVYVWGVLAWLVLPLHANTLGQLPAGDMVANLLMESGTKTGAYSYPFPDAHEPNARPEDQKAAWDEFTRRHEQGPIFSIYYQAAGSPPMGPDVMGRGFAIDLISSLLAVLIVAPLAQAGASFWQRWKTVFCLGLFASFVSYGALWNWMLFPSKFIVDMMLDVTICWTLAGCVIAAILKAPAPTAAPTTTPTAASHA